ncbi:DUF4932 domain-containing protein [Algoriphagus limi]|uniref:DUF4932 domain-containing protein n=1 Tax=Algoriphagus limi TaxID=2975273 RepID=A0ABT2G3X0_9BACT|nr:DUF4932 domain-containing protein [Algoriphagus limi]MCS5489792.1 DUF4932 domain-containing protein [Algoriphagus limi]
MKHLVLVSILLLFSMHISFGQHSASFSEEYREMMHDSVTYEILEVSELFHVIAALTPFGKGNTEIIDKSTGYYQEVLDYFEKYQEHPVIKEIQKELRRNRYNRLKMDACGFFFNQNGNIEKDKTYPTLSFESKNWLEPYIEQLEDFSKETNFRSFYENHKDFYSQQTSMQSEQLAVKSHWDWLEKKFDNRYQSYRITFSPLVYGSHSANYFIDGDFSQSIMFIGPPYVTDKYSKKQLEGLAGRMVFTEIDHNYINPLSDKYQEEIKTLIGDLEKWNNMKYRDYSNALSAFNEYATFAFYSLYVIDNYNEEDASLIINRCEEVMENRGFIKFPEFNQKLVNYYSKNKELTGEEIYQSIFSGEYEK